mgnify:CR=1 FL=1
MSSMAYATITVCGGALVCSLLSAFVPEGATKKTVALVIGAFMVCCLISPLSSAISSIKIDTQLPTEIESEISTSDEAYSNLVIKQAEENLEQSLTDILLQNNIRISDCKIVLAKSQSDSIIIGDISIYMSNEYKSQNEKIGTLTYKSFGAYPRITYI